MVWLKKHHYFFSFYFQNDKENNDIHIGVDAFNFDATCSMVFLCIDVPSMHPYVFFVFLWLEIR